MNFLKRYVVILGFLGSMLNLAAQETINAPVRTPEQEAAFQTEKMQKELNLSREQVSAIYEINLRHARERQVSNSRSQALERVKVKDSEVRKVLTKDQYVRLQNKRYERSSGVQSFRTLPGERRNIYTNPRTIPQTGTRSSDPPVRTIPQNNNTRSVPQNGSRSSGTVIRTTPQDNNTRSVPQNGNRSSGTVTRTVPQNNNSRSSGSSTRSVPQNSSRSSGNNQPSRSSESSRNSSNERSQRR